MTERRIKPREGQVVLHRLPDPERLEKDLHIRIADADFDKLCHIARNRNRKVSELARCTLLDFIHGGAI